MANTRHSMKHVKNSSLEQARLLYVSTSKYEGDWHSILHSHPFSELFYVVSGSGSFIAEGEEFPVMENDLVIINPHVDHTEKSEEQAPLVYIVLGVEGLSFSFEQQENATALHHGGMNEKSVRKFSAAGTNFYVYLNIMLEEISRKKKNYEIVCQNLLEVLLICVLRNETLSIVNNSTSNLSRECAQIKNYLDSNYSQNITLDSLASITHMNKYYLSHAFTKHIGVSPINYLLQKRIAEGKSLLESTTYSIAEISTMLGFSSQSYFSQAFKKATGITPIQHRIEFRSYKH